MKNEIERDEIQMERMVFSAIFVGFVLGIPLWFACVNSLGAIILGITFIAELSVFILWGKNYPAPEI